MYQWEVAGAHAYPWVVIIDEDVVGRPPTPKELKQVEAIAGALAVLVEANPRFARASRKHPVKETFAVTTGTGPVPVEVTLTAPYDVDHRRGAPRRARQASRRR